MKINVICNHESIEFDGKFVKPIDIEQIEIDEYFCIVNYKLKTKTKTKIKPCKRYHNEEIENDYSENIEKTISINFLSRCSKCKTIVPFKTKYVKGEIEDIKFIVKQMLKNLIKNVDTCDCGGLIYPYSYEIIEGKELYCCDGCPFPGKFFPENAMGNEFDCMIYDNVPCQFSSERKEIANEKIK